MYFRTYVRGDSVCLFFIIENQFVIIPVENFLKKNIANNL
ncbi:hypothetical protein M105_4576 [Bacteroides fragilis str. 1009-4-F |uniref:Uncharacterized protein n=1 Tax=Bacteroides fragilis str. 3998T(B)3 TaxID=1339316 RepID=A0A015TWK2_BACFG|nr:hypothetical protein M125_4569 [Bacteroides fragilis str. 3998T(B)3]EXY98239.1 hypothetical protein M081_4796 [Bacteroides fragilis str. 3998 T(B) 4]EXZ08395.1 hypothetical protein M073_3640 [Bacteroides fragilis str. DS-71]EXZ17723.1 hypothetical protein M067_3945 [Bacteroides fragilis str. J-143-4]EYA27769.1 hypothetical protein M106_3843 [Bacteroides fragilis str. 1009-4-F \